MKTSITVNDLIYMCEDKGVSLDTPIVVCDIDQWNKPILYPFDIEVNTFESGKSEIVMTIQTEDTDE